MDTQVKAVELKDLWRRCKLEGDDGARERLVVAYSPLVKFVAGRMAAGLPSHVEEAHKKPESRLQRAPTEEEMADELGMELEDLRSTLLDIANSSVLALEDL